MINMSNRIYFVLIVFYITSGLACFSYDMTPQSIKDNEITNPSYSNFGDSIRMIASLLFVLALIIGGVFLLKKVPLYKRFMLNSKKPVSVITNVSLGHKRSICIVKVANEMLILGLTGTNISLLSKMSADEFLSYMNVNVTENYNPDDIKTSFLDQLKKLIGSKQQGA